jgi:GNAT superfamily N-acetyltransferase
MTGALEFRVVGPGDYEAVRRFLCDLGWQRRLGDPDRFRRLMERTDRAVMAVEAGRVVGFARALCDGVSNGYLSMVAVAADRRGRGIGRELVARLMGDDPQITWVLRAGRGSAGFWVKLGFRPAPLAMERPRTDPGQEQRP